MINLKISTKGRYGLKAMIYLVSHSQKDSLTLKNISEAQNISERYLEQIFSALRKGGIIKGIKGPQGGYFLNKKPCEITVGDIIRILEGDIATIQIKEDADKMDNFIQESVWSKIDENINKVIDNITLEELSQKYTTLEESENIMYYI